MNRDENWVGVTPAPPVRPVSCARDGHDYQHLVTVDGELLRIDCTVCHRTWRVEEQ